MERRVTNVLDATLRLHRTTSEADESVKVKSLRVKASFGLEDLKDSMFAM